MKKDRKQNKTEVTQVTAVVGDANRDPLTGEPGSHALGTGLGAAGGAATGAVVGAVAGPIGAVAGAAIGAVAGGLAGHGAAELIDPTVEETYWRTAYTTAPYFVKARNYDFDDYGPAYRFGWESSSRHVGSRFEEVESELARAWDGAKASSRLGWSDAKSAVHDAWQRVSDTAERLTPGDSDNDGK